MPDTDPRLAGQMIRALSALVELRDAELRVLKEDTDARIAALEAKIADAADDPA